MTNLFFITITGILLGCLSLWGFKYLPGERWQMMAIVPMAKHGDSSHWRGANLTYYGFFIATSQLLAIALLLILLGAMEISLAGTTLATIMLLAVCLPAARIVAMIVEKKRHTFTVGGASFVGIILAPLAIQAAGIICSRFGDCYLPMMPVLAAMAIAYSLGEGLGRLACLSYGCCYGKPLRECSPLIQSIFKRTGVIFYGNTKKAEYESHLAGERLVPIQAITCMLYTTTALLGCWLFLHSHFTVTLVLCMTVTQVWRLLSEMLRADFRGFGKVSVYQKMGAIAVIYTIGLALVNKSLGTLVAATPSISHGLHSLWNPGVIIGLQLAWLIFFIYFGRSTVTCSTVSFTLLEERI